jgi:hypothetical protein
MVEWSKNIKEARMKRIVSMAVIVSVAMSGTAWCRQDPGQYFQQKAARQFDRKSYEEELLIKTEKEKAVNTKKEKATKAPNNIVNVPAKKSGETGKETGGAGKGDVLK